MSEQDQAQAPETQFVLQRIYVKDLSFESPKSPDAFLQQWKPQINLEMNVSHNVLSDDNYEVVLSLTITARNEAEEAVYLVELQQAGIFLVRGMEGETLARHSAASAPVCCSPTPVRPSTRLLSRAVSRR